MKALYITLALIFSVGSFAQKQKPATISPERKIYINIPEPSDVCIHPNGKTLFIVSDNGLLFETDMEGNVIRKADFKGFDCEGVFADENHVYVVDEFSRTVTVFDINTLKIEKTASIPYSGGRNGAYEAITFNKATNKFMLFTEKNPIYLFELNEKLQKENEIDLSKMTRDVSAASYHNDHLWILGDEDMTVFKLNPKTYEVLNSWKLPIVNPEGLTFDQNGNMLILSDDMQILYYFKNPEN